MCEMNGNLVSQAQVLHLNWGDGGPYFVCLKKKKSLLE